MERRGIIAAGNWLVDHVKIIDTWPEQDALANILEQSLGNGGCAFTVLVDLARLGATFPLAGIGCIGQDAPGDYIVETCRRHRIHTERLLRLPDQRTSTTDVMTVRSTGRRTFFHHRGANAQLGPEHFDFQNSDAKLFHLGYLLLLDRLDEVLADGSTGAARVLEQARRAGLRTSVDVVSEDSERFAEVVLPALPHVDVCLMNEFEAGRVTGVALRSSDGIARDGLEEAARALFRQGLEGWLVVHFPEGAFAAHPSGKRVSVGSVQVPPERIVGTVGAGDAFAAGLLMAAHRDLPMATCLWHGTCAAAASLGAASSSGGIDSMEACLHLGERYGFRSL